MKRFDIINHLATKRNIENYLEIGVLKGENIRRIKIKNKDGVDPGLEGHLAKEVNFKMTSNDFFKQNSKKYDMVFIDGLHHSEQVDLDISNSIEHTVENGIIVLHDCSPANLAMTIRPRKQVLWTGDVYKSVLKFQKNNENHTYFTVNTDHGVGVILKNQKPLNKLTATEYDSAINDWNFFNANRKALLNLISTKEFLDFS